MTLFVREYSWMWTDLHLSLAECRVYAYIYGLTHGEKKGYDGSKRHLAELLGISTSATKNILDALVEKHLIACTGGLWHSVHSENTDSVHSENENVRSQNENVLSENSPHTPLNNNIKDRKQADMQTDFDKFFDKFSAEYRNRFAATQLLWDHRSKAAQDAMYEEVKDEQDFAVNKNPYFFVQDFPEPKPEWKTGGETDEDLVQVRYNGTYKICTRATMKLFGLDWVRDW